MTITAQLEHIDARDTLRGILQCFTKLRIRVLIDFYFMMFSKTRLVTIMLIFDENYICVIQGWTWNLLPECWYGLPNQKNISETWRWPWRIRWTIWVHWSWSSAWRTYSSSNGTIRCSIWFKYRSDIRTSTFHWKSLDPIRKSKMDLKMISRTEFSFHLIQNELHGNI